MPLLQPFIIAMARHHRIAAMLAGKFALGLRQFDDMSAAARDRDSLHPCGQHARIEGTVDPMTTAHPAAM